MPSPRAAGSAAIAHLPQANLYCSVSRPREPPPSSSALPSSSAHCRVFYGGVTPWISHVKEIPSSKVEWCPTSLKKKISVIPRCSGPSSTNDINGTSSDQSNTPFGYTRKDVLLIGVGVTVLGIGLKYGLEFVGVDPLLAGNVVQLVVVLGLTIGWISTYIFRVSNKEMTYAQQLRDYENKVMQKRLEGLTEAELQALLEQVEEEKERQPSGEQVHTCYVASFPLSLQLLAHVLVISLLYQWLRMLPLYLREIGSVPSSSHRDVRSLPLDYELRANLATAQSLTASIESVSTSARSLTTCVRYQVAFELGGARALKYWCSVSGGRIPTWFFLRGDTDDARLLKEESGFMIARPHASPSSTMVYAQPSSAISGDRPSDLCSAFRIARVPLLELIEGGGWVKLGSSCSACNYSWKGSSTSFMPVGSAYFHAWEISPRAACCHLHYVRPPWELGHMASWLYARPSSTVKESSSSSSCF
ncbi:hypothetical protein Dimus_022045 [Dionaea muscipula]